MQLITRIKDLWFILFYLTFIALITFNYFRFKFKLKSVNPKGSIIMPSFTD